MSRANALSVPTKPVWFGSTRRVRRLVPALAVARRPEPYSSETDRCCRPPWPPPVGFGQLLARRTDLPVPFEVNSGPCEDWSHLPFAWCWLPSCSGSRSFFTSGPMIFRQLTRSFSKPTTRQKYCIISRSPLATKPEPWPTPSRPAMDFLRHLLARRDPLHGLRRYTRPCVRSCSRSSAALPCFPHSSSWPSTAFSAPLLASLSSKLESSRSAARWVCGRDGF